jgi:hypothetical protein
MRKSKIESAKRWMGSWLLVYKFSFGEEREREDGLLFMS